MGLCYHARKHSGIGLSEAAAWFPYLSEKGHVGGVALRAARAEKGEGMNRQPDVTDRTGNGTIRSINGTLLQCGITFDFEPCLFILRG